MSGGVVWITGLSGAGKTTVATALCTRLSGDGHRPIRLDGDELRAILPDPVGHQRAERLRLARFYGALAGGLAAQGHLVVCATISLFHEVQRWNREKLPNYVEVLLRVPADELAARGRRDQPGPTVGRDIAPEFPLRPDLVIDQYGPTTPEAAARAVAELPAVRAWTRPVE